MCSRYSYRHLATGQIFGTRNLDQGFLTYLIKYTDRKRSICTSPSTTVQLITLQDGSSTHLLLHPTYGPVCADNCVENYYVTLSSLLNAPAPGTILPPWSQPIDSIAPEETDIPDPTSFPDDKLAYLTSTPEEARLV